MLYGTAALVLLLAFAEAACAREPAPNARRFQLTGLVVGHEGSPPRVVVFTRGGGGRGRGTGDGREGGRGDAGSRGRGAFAGAADMFRALQMSGPGPDGYPLDVHPPKLPLPPQDPIWIETAAAALSDRAALLAHARAICGVPISREVTPELRRALALKPRPEDFI
jgi:hypothetical protein